MGYAMKDSNSWCGQLTMLVVEFDLKGDSMIHGKKGFDRLVYASKNALGAPVTWLFCNTSKTSTAIRSAL